MSLSIPVLLCVALHLFLLATLGLRCKQQTLHQEDPRRSRIPAVLIQCIGILTAVYTFLLPHITGLDDPMKLCVARVIVLFYGCKLLDLTLVRSTNPPTLVKVDGETDPMHSWKSNLRYTFLIFSEMRYHSFDIAVKQKQRLAEESRDVTYPVIAMCLIAAIDYFLSLAELKCICLLLLLQIGFESLHSLLHPGCQHPLFFQPFMAASAGSFWTTHWHAGADSFLRSLGYSPGKWLGGTWLGVLATFNLTGIWHGWAASALVDDEHAIMLGAQVWALFMLQGVLCIVERLIWGSRQGSLVQRLLVWAISVESAAQCFRFLQQHSNLPILRA